jgi:hypothetical protein
MSPGLLSRRTAAIGMVLAAAVSVPAIQAGAATSAPATQTVSYAGHHFTVPATWPVIDLTKNPTACLRLDQHAVYLGAPGANQDCPADLLGTTETLDIQTAPASAGEAMHSTIDSTTQTVSATAPGVTVSASYGTDPAEIEGILASAGLPSPSAASAPSAPSAASAAPQAATPKAAVPSVATSSTDFTGEGFDPCAAPSSAAMSAWKASSPYGAIGIYIGGSDRSCAQPNLTAGWVSTEASAGWHFFPLYPGPQACVTVNGQSCVFQLDSPASQGISSADDAAAQAESLGFGPGSLITYDMEAYPSSDTTAVLTFLTSWTNELHADGYKSGLYSSSSSGISDLVKNYTNAAYTMPDVIDDALWNGDANTADPAVPAADWANHQRIHQYAGGNNETYGGYEMNVDNDYLDVGVSTPATSSAAVFSDGTGEPAAAHHADGRLELFAVSPTGAVQNKYETVADGPWSTWNDFGPSSVVVTQVAVGVHADGRVEVFAVTSSGGIMNKYETVADGPWSTWNDFGPSGTVSQIATVRHADGRLEVFAVMSDGSVENKFETVADGDWSGWNSFAPASTAAQITPILHSDGRLEILAVSPSGGVSNKYETSPDGPWAGWFGFGPSGTVIRVTSGMHADGRLEVFATLSDGSVENKYEETADGIWSGWNSFAPAGTATNGLSVATHADGRLELYAVSGTGGISNKYETAPDAAWAGWYGFGPSGTVATLNTTVHADGRVEVFAVMSDGSIENKFETVADGAWSTWSDFASAGTA